MSKKEEFDAPDVAFTSLHRDRRGRYGRDVMARVGARYPKVYSFATHGLTAEQIDDRIAEIETRHAAKEAKVDELQAVVGTVFHVNLDAFRIGDATLRDRGNDIEIVVQIFQDRGNDEWALVPGMPIRRVYHEIRLVPDAAGVEAMARGYVETQMMRDIEHDDVVRGAAEKIRARRAKREKDR
jgi:hypothetical protein